ncbi:hypothetical protein ACJJTC_005837 [Scirpophaga incertulas]
MKILPKTIVFVISFSFYTYFYECAKINTPRVLLPWFENLTVNFTFEIIEGGCYTWSLSRDDIIDLEPLFEDTWGHCSRAARVSVSKTCVPPGSVIILAEEVNSGEILRGDVDIDKIRTLKVMSTTWKLYLEEAPEAFEVVAYDDQGNTFSTLEGITFAWTIENLGNNIGEDLIVTFVRWRDTDYEAPRGVSEIEATGLRSHSVLLYGQAMGECRVVVCLRAICTDFELNVVASVVLTPAMAIVAPGDLLQYRVVRARAGRLTVQNVEETLYNMKVANTAVAMLEDTISQVRAAQIGTTSVILMSGATEVATATLAVAEPHSIRVSLRPSSLLIRGEDFIVHTIVLTNTGHALTAGSDILIRLSVDGEADVHLIQSTENGTLTDAVAQNLGHFTVTARLHSIAGRILQRKVEGEVSAEVVDPLNIVPSELFVAWTDTVLDIALKHVGGGDEPVLWSLTETPNSVLTLTSNGVVTVKGVGSIDVRVQLKNYPHLQAFGKVWSTVPELVQVSSSGQARVGRLHNLHVALTASHPTTGELFNFHTCDCGSFAVALLEGPEPLNVTAATWVQPMEGACCVLQCVWLQAGISSVRVSRGRAGDTARVSVRAAPALVWPPHAAALRGAVLPVLAEGEVLIPQTSDARIADLATRDGPPPHRYPNVQLFTFKCHRKGDAHLELTSHTDDDDDEQESVEFEAACAPHVSRIRLEPADPPANCSGGPRVWLRPRQEVIVKVTLLDAIGRELLDERGPKASWGLEPHHPAIEYTATDRLYVEMHPEYAPVPVPYKYYQVVIAGEQTIGWSGALKVHVPEATASINARVVAPLKCEPLKLTLAWEGETLNDIASVSGGSGRYAVGGPKGVSASVLDGRLSASVPGPGSYELNVYDLCVHGEKQLIEIHIEEVLNVEVSTSRAVCVDGCVPISALVQGVSHRYLTASHAPEWRVLGDVAVRDGALCGLREGAGRVRASLGGVWSAELEVLVFPPLGIVPQKAALPPGGRLQLRHRGGPPPHLATLHYHLVSQQPHIEVSSSGFVHGLSVGTAQIKLVAIDHANIEMASAQSEVEIIPISGLRVRAATQSLLVGAPGPLWVEAGALPASSLAALHPIPRITWTIRDPSTARLYTTHIDDYLERSAVEGLSVRVVPLKAGVITVDVRVRNMGQSAETRSWDSTIEILGISDIRVSVEGLTTDVKTGGHLALAVGSTIRLKTMPKSVWTAYGQGSFEISPNGELKALAPGHGIVIAQHKDDRNNIYREAATHVEVAVPHYCTAEPSGEADETALRLVLRNYIGRELLAPEANVTAVAPLLAHTRRNAASALGNELFIPNLDAIGTFMGFQSIAGGVTVKDEVWVTGSEAGADRIIAVSGWAFCLDGVGWRAPSGVEVYAGSGVSLGLLMQGGSARHTLRLERPPLARRVLQLAATKMEFLGGEWPASMVPLSIQAAGLAGGPLLCSEEQKYALQGVEVAPPYVCRAAPPHTVTARLDIARGEFGCSIVPAVPIVEPSEVELCAEWGTAHTCTRVLLLPEIDVSHAKVSMLHPPTAFTVNGHPRALKLVQITSSPGFKLEMKYRENEITVFVKNEVSACGLGFVNVRSKLTSQEIRVEVERECDVPCGTLLGALFSLLKPYLPTLFTVAAVIIAYTYIQSKLQQKAPIRMPVEPVQTVLPEASVTPTFNRTRTFSRSPYASNGPASPVYGDTSVLPDSSFSPNSTRVHSRFL